MLVSYNEYPKWIVFDGDKSNIPPGVLVEEIKGSDSVKILIRDEEIFYSIGDDARKKEIQKDLKDNHNIDIDLRKYKGESGLGAIEAFYKAAISDSKKK